MDIHYERSSMYTPEPFKITDHAIIDAFIANHPFATLVSQKSGKIDVTHLPVNKFKDGKLYAHVAKANAHASLSESQEVCCIFNGEHAYISPTYYKTTFNVPTWNYSAVHIYGTINYVDNNEKVWQLLGELTTIYEGEKGWKLPQEEQFKALTNALQFFEINVTNIEATFKFNQNKSKEDIQSVIQCLRDENAYKVADFMEYITSK